MSFFFFITSTKKLSLIQTKNCFNKLFLKKGRENFVLGNSIKIIATLTTKPYTFDGLFFRCRENFKEVFFFPTATDFHKSYNPSNTKFNIWTFHTSFFSFYFPQKNGTWNINKFFFFSFQELLNQKFGGNSGYSVASCSSCFDCIDQLISIASK